MNCSFSFSMVSNKITMEARWFHTLACLGTLATAAAYAPCGPWRPFCAQLPRRTLGLASREALNDFPAKRLLPLPRARPARAAAEDEAVAPLPLLHRPLPQLILCAAGYGFHVAVLSRRHVELGALSVGWDTLAGLAVLVGAAARRVRNGRPALPPWLLGPRSARAEEEAGALLDLSAAPRKEKLDLLLTGALLLLAPIFGAKFLSPVADVVLYALALAGAPLNEARMLSARLLLEQTALYAACCKLLSARHPGFFSRWVRWSARGPWLAPVLGGYAASLALFNLVEPLNQALLPQLGSATEGMVAQLASPSDRSAASLLLASITPCVGAPLYEELQSRAFIFQALTAALPVRGALALSGLLFGAQHFQLSLVLPLSVTGWFWAVLFVSSRNLLVPVAIHALWNARIFVGSYLGL